jgi:5-formyltetrahydrofolate cyclo-ligase
MTIQEKKKVLREKTWRLLEKKGVGRFPLPLKGRIPNFEGAKEAAKLVQKLDQWKKARIIVANPDSAQRPIRELALREKKILIMASPKLKQGYLEIKDAKGKEEFASSIRGAFKYGKKLIELPKPDLIVTGCVAVDKKGWRLGKGGGYGDKEINELTKKFGKIPIVTTVHPLQIIKKVPYDKQDTRVDYIITPTQIIRPS